MADPTVRELKLIQYLNEAYGKEKELETALQEDIKATTRPPYKKRLQEHLKETKAQARVLERRIKKLGGTAEVAGVATSAARKGAALAKGPLQALRGTGEAEKMLKNAKTEYLNEHEEIATYSGIEALAEALSDGETAKLAREHRRQEERMAKFLEKLIPQLTKAVVTEEIPARERKPVEAKKATARRAPAKRSRATASAGGAKRTSSRTTRRAAASRSSNGASASRSSGSSSRRRTTASGGRRSSGGASSSSGGGSSSS